MVMARLKDLDEVAYVRFASVYRQFRDINTFMEELHKLLKEIENMYFRYVQMRSVIVVLCWFNW